MKKFVLFAVSIFILAVLVFFMINLYVYLQGKRYIVYSIDNVPHEQVAIILGAAVTSGGVPSSVLNDRIITAIDLYKRGIVSKILMSGANPTLTNNEVNPIRQILIDSGVPVEDIFLDHAGFDTYSSMYRAKAVFQISSAIIVTQEFHLTRAVYLARSFGINAYGFPADRGNYSLNNYLREFLSRPYAFFDVLIRRIPKYLGPTIPITGDGLKT